MRLTILVVEDEVKVRDIVSAYLKKEGYQVLTAGDGETAISLANRCHPDAIILDMMLPKKSGSDVCTEIRRNSNTPIIILTARNSEDDRIDGLDLGADDYVSKPFSPRELMARVRAVLRRVKRDPLDDETLVINRGAIVLDVGARSVLARGKSVDLTATEFHLLLLMAQNPGMALSRSLLIDKVLGVDYEGFDRTIDSHIKNLRQKIEPNPSSPEFVKTIYKVGYKLDAKVEKL